MTGISVIDSDIKHCSKLLTDIKMYNMHKCISFYTSLDEAISKLPRDKPDVILINLDCPCTTPGRCAVKLLLGILPHVKIVMLTENCDEDCFQELLDLGISAFVGKDIKSCYLNPLIKVTNGNIVCLDRDMLRKLRRKENKKKTDQVIMDKEIADRKKVDQVKTDKESLPFHLTPQQISIVHFLKEGLTRQQIADKFGDSINTIKTQIKRIYKILDVHCMWEALEKCKALGFILNICVVTLGVTTL